MSARSRRVLFITAGGVTKASARFRVYQFLPYFECFGNVEVVDVIPVNTSLPLAQIARAFLSIACKASTSDIVFIQKARLPASFVRLLDSFCQVVYDFDDAVFLPPPTWPEGMDFDGRRRRLDFTLGRASAVIAGNQYLANYARAYSDNVWVVPTVVDTGQMDIDSGCFNRWQLPRQVFQPLDAEQSPPDPLVPTVIGWIGGPEHVHLLDALGPVLRSLQKRTGIVIKVVSSRPWTFPGLHVINKEWRLEYEVADVQSFDVGLMPLDTGDPFLQGKCGFKIIEYIAVGALPVASSVGANVEIIEHGTNGFLVSHSSEWEGYLETLVHDRALRNKMSVAARHRAVENYSVSSVLSTYVALFETLIP